MKITSALSKIILLALLIFSNTANTKEKEKVGPLGFT